MMMFNMNMLKHFIHEPEFKFRLKYLKSEEGIIDIKAYHATVIEYNINTL